MDVALFDYELPSELIAQEPAEPRDSSRLLVMDRARGTWVDRRFSDLPAFLREGDCVVANQSRVIPARLLGTVEPGGHPVELLMLRPVDGERWHALVRPGRRCRTGAQVSVAAGAARVRIIAEKEDGVREVTVEAPWPVLELLDHHGLPPLPPYIARHDAPKPDDRERYQTVYARHDGSVAAPTAGLHFTADLLGRVGAIGAEVHFLTLHVASARFAPSEPSAWRSTGSPRRVSRSPGDRRGGQSSSGRGPAHRCHRNHDHPGTRVGGHGRWPAPDRPRGRRSLHLPRPSLPAGRRPRHELPPPALDAAPARCPPSAGARRCSARLSPRRRRALSLLLVRRRDADRLGCAPSSSPSSRPTAPRAPDGCAPPRRDRDAGLHAGGDAGDGEEPQPR